MARAISAHTALAGVLGDPVRHSLSPAMHNAALTSLGLNWVYLALPTPAAALETVVKAMETLNCRGLNVTIPHKQAVAALCSELCPLAERLGAVNTLVPRPQGGWLGTNTDVEGFLAPLRNDGDGDAPGWAGRGAVVLGCGGSARAVVAGLVALGCAPISVAARRPEAVAAFVAACRAWAPQLEPLAWEHLGAALAEAALLVNTTPVGMATSGDAEAVDRCPLRPAELDALAVGCTVYDLIYTPRPTALLRAAAARQLPCLDGLEMLVQQGAASLRLWSGLETVPVAAMRDAAITALAASSQQPGV